MSFKTHYQIQQDEVLKVINQIGRYKDPQAQKELMEKLKKEDPKMYQAVQEYTTKFSETISKTGLQYSLYPTKKFKPFHDVYEIYVTWVPEKQKLNVNIKYVDQQDWIRFLKMEPRLILLLEQRRFPYKLNLFPIKLKNEFEMYWSIQYQNPPTRIKTYFQEEFFFKDLQKLMFLDDKKIQELLEKNKLL